MKYYPTPYVRMLDQKREANRRASWAFFAGCIFMAILMVVLHLAARDLGL